MALLFTTEAQFRIEVGTSLVSIFHPPPDCGFNIYVKNVPNTYCAMVFSKHAYKKMSMMMMMMMMTMTMVVVVVVRVGMVMVIYTACARKTHEKMTP